jgi:hypothetical protein
MKTAACEPLAPSQGQIEDRSRATGRDAIELQLPNRTMRNDCFWAMSRPTFMEAATGS